MDIGLASGGAFVLNLNEMGRGIEPDAMRMMFLPGCFLCASLVACSTAKPPIAVDATTTSGASPSIESLVAAVRDDPSKKPLLARALMSQQILMIPNPHAKSVAVLPFDQNERSFIPVFSDERIFDEEAYGTGFEKKAIAVDAHFFASLLKGDEIVILNPGHRPAIEFKGSELKALVDPSR
jgi:type III secretion system (T3SS) SseB-like protein